MPEKGTLVHKEKLEQPRSRVVARSCPMLGGMVPLNEFATSSKWLRSPASAPNHAGKVPERRVCELRNDLSRVSAAS